MAYGILAWLVAGAFSGRGVGNHSFLYMVLIVIFSTLYGMSDEWHQSFVPGRDASAWDVLADTLGALIVSLALFRWPFLHPRSQLRLSFRYSPQRTQRAQRK